MDKNERLKQKIEELKKNIAIQKKKNSDSEGEGTPQKQKLYSQEMKESKLRQEVLKRRQISENTKTQQKKGNDYQPGM